MAEKCPRFPYPPHTHTHTHTTLTSLLPLGPAVPSLDARPLDTWPVPALGGVPSGRSPSTYRPTLSQGKGVSTAVTCASGGRARDGYTHSPLLPFPPTSIRAARQQGVRMYVFVGKKPAKLDRTAHHRSPLSRGGGGDEMRHTQRDVHTTRPTAETAVGTWRGFWMMLLLLTCGQDLRTRKPRATRPITACLSVSLPLLGLSSHLEAAAGTARETKGRVRRADVVVPHIQSPDQRSGLFLFRPSSLRALPAASVHVSWSLCATRCFGPRSPGVCPRERVGDWGVWAPGKVCRP